MAPVGSRGCPLNKRADHSVVGPFYLGCHPSVNVQTQAHHKGAGVDSLVIIFLKRRALRGEPMSEKRLCRNTAASAPSSGPKVTRCEVLLFPSAAGRSS